MTLDEEKNCESCGEHITQRETTYQGQTRLQWQNDNHKPHFKYNQAEKKAYCPNVTQPPKSETKDTSEPTSKELLEMAKKIYKENEDINDIDEFIKAAYDSRRQHAARKLVNWAADNDIMDEVGIKHPSRMAFHNAVDE